MKKLLILLIFLFIGMDSFSQDKKDTTSVTAREVYNDAKSVLKSLGEALKVGSEHVYEVLVRQQITNSVTNVIGMILGLIFSYSLYKFANDKKDPNDDWDDTIYIIPLVMSIIIFACVFIGGSIVMQETVMGFVNPEYGAIKQILDLIKH